MKKRVVIIIAACVVAATLMVSAIIAFIIGVYSYVNSLGNMEEYTIEGVEVTSITEVVGSRKVNAYSYKGTLSGDSKSYTYYDVIDPFADIEAYCDYLSDCDGFTVVEKPSFGAGATLARTDVKENGGNIIIYVIIEQYGQGYKINIVSR